MNFLQLCQKTALESGTIASLPSFTTVVAPSGRAAKIVGWVSDAWVKIQTERPDWLFRNVELSHALVIGQNQYDPVADFALNPTLAEWLPDTCNRLTMSLYDPAIGTADEGPIEQKSYDEWRRCYYMGAQTNNRPVMWAIAPTGKLCVGPAPDKAYVLRGQYKRSAQVLAADADLPIIPADYHNVIVGQALRNMAESDEAYEGLIPKAQKYEELRNSLVIAQTPQVYYIR